MKFIMKIKKYMNEECFFSLVDIVVIGILAGTMLCVLLITLEVNRVIYK